MQDTAPETAGFIVPKINTDHFLLTFGGDGQNRIDRLAFYASILSNFKVHRIEPQDRINTVQGPVLPFLDGWNNPVGNRGKRAIGEFHPIHFFEMRLNVAVGKAPPVQRQDLLIDVFTDDPLTLGNSLWIERGISVARRKNIKASKRALDIFLCVAITTVLCL